MSTLTLADLIKFATEPGVERILAHLDYRSCEADGPDGEVNVHNCTVTDKYQTDEATWAQLKTYFIRSDDWKFTPSMTHSGYMARPVMTAAETAAATAAWNARHPAEDYSLEARC